MAGGRVRRARFGVLGAGVALLAAACGGGPDSSFGGDGIVRVVYSTTSRGFSVAVTPTDEVVSAGVVQKRGNDIAVARQHSDGSPDTSFGGFGSGRFTWDSGSN